MTKSTLQAILLILLGAYVLAGLVYMFVERNRVAGKVQNKTTVDVSSFPWHLNASVREVMDSDPQFRRDVNRLQSNEILLHIGGLALILVNFLIAGLL